MKTKFTFFVLSGHGLVRFADGSNRVFQDGDTLVCAVLVLPMVRTSLL